MQKKEKDPYKALSGVFKDAIQAMNAEQIRTRIAEMAIEHAALMKAKKADPELAQRKLAVEKAVEKYKDSSSLNNLKFKLQPKDDKEVVADLVLERIDIQAKQDDDEEVTQAKARLATSNETYTGSTKITKLKIKYCKYVLEGMGKA